MDETELKFIKSERGKPLLLHAGYKYNFAVKNKSGTTNWRCTHQKECNTSITLNTNNIIIKEPRHSCRKDQVRNTIDFIMDDCKKEVCNNFDSVQKIFENKFCNHSPQYLEKHNIPSFASKKDTLYRARAKYLKVGRGLVRNSKDVRLPNHIVEDFFLFDEGIDDKIIFFGSPLAKIKLRQVNAYYGDGTFRAAPKPFYQIYTLHADISHGDNAINFVPLLYAFLPNKSQNTYERFFLVVKHQFGVNIKFYKCDYEIAVITAVKEIFPEAVVKGCYYHYQNAIWRKSKKIGFTDTPEGKKITYFSTLLPLLPPMLIPEGYLAICEMAPNNDYFDKFNSYFNAQWITKITSDIFSCYGEKNRTTNAIEGWHRRLNTKINSKPSLFKCILILKKEAEVQDIKIQKNSLHYKDNKRNKKMLEKNEKINDIITDCGNGKISVIDCIMHLASLKC